MSRYEVDSTHVQSASAAVAASTTVIRSEVAAMMRHLTDLQNSWRGGAATAFAGVMADWSSTQTKVEASLESITAALAAAANAYADAEHNASRLFTQR